MLLATALALLITGCAQQTFAVQNKPAAVAQKPSPIISSFLELERKAVDAAKFVAAQKMLLKRNPANIRKWIARFYYFRHLYSAGSALCIALIVHDLPIDMGNSIYYSLIYFWVPSSCFCIVIRPLSWGWNNPVQRCLPVGEAALSTPEAVVASRTDWRTALMCNRRRPAATSHTQSIIFSFNASPTPSCILHRRSNIRWRICMSIIAAFASFQFSGIFVALGFVGNGVITVMINSPWQADDDADNQSGDNRRWLCSYINLSDRSARFFEFCNQAVYLCSNGTDQRPVEAQILLQRSIAWQISPRSITR